MHTNALCGEKSPYLLQHAHNPVDWLPWGEAAFQKARAEDKPVFLSVGYSTCHWCHVMERESFENEEIAALLNRSFVPIKVDREERPDVDRIYMTFVQATSGRGGWPMSVFLTPDLRPFFGGTYFPPAGFAELLERVAEAWRSDRSRVAKVGEEIVLQLNSSLASVGGASLTKELLESALQTYRHSFDARHGGFDGAPKFPRPVSLNFLLRYGGREMVFATLDAMAHGGIHDHLGGGFHRYSVDDRWRVPHFEKMLYDQAQLSVAYLEGYQLSGNEFYAGVARGILDYVLRDMRDPGGGFYSAEDADSPGEGDFYVWRREEIETALGDEAGAFLRHYRLDEHAGTLYETAPPPESLAPARARLLAQRAQRRRPHRDDKILTAWNGLMISAFAKAAQALGETRYLDAARNAAAFLAGRMYDAASGLLLRRYRDGDAAIPGFLDDYAFFVQALLDLYEATFDAQYLDLAVQLTAAQRARFEDSTHGGFYSTEAGDAALLLRIKEEYDGAEPAGNSVAALNLLRLAALTDRDEYREAAGRTLHAFSQHLAVAPTASPLLLVALAQWLDPPRQITVAGDPAAADTRALLREIHRRFLPGYALRSGPQPHGGAAAAYICEDFTCRPPLADPAELARALLHCYS